LRGVHGAALAWPAFVTNELNPMFHRGCLPSIADGFAQFLSAPAIAQKVRKGIETQIRDGKMTPYDSHPPLRDRVDAAERLTIPSPEADTGPASQLLDNVRNEEARFLRTANPELMQKSLRRVAWEEQGTSVLIPSWSSFVAQYSPLLQGITVGTMAESLGRLPEIAPQIRDPQGTLLTPQQRIERARALLGTALALALVNNGWQLHSRPGEFHLDRGNEKLDPYKVMLQLSEGAISKDAWCTKSSAWGMENVPLASVAPTTKGASQQSLPFG
jgi:heat shock protein HtpX